MQIQFNLLALCALHTGAWGAAAFFVQPPQAGQTTTLFSSPPSTPVLLDSETAAGPTPATSAFARKGEDVWEGLEPVTVQGGALRTWSYPSPDVERVLVSLRTTGNHIMCNLKLCQGPDNTPQQMDITVGKGMLRPFKVLIETPGEQGSVFIRNTGPLEYPIYAGVGAEMVGEPGSAWLYEMEEEFIVQGAGAIKTYSFDPEVREVKCVLNTDGRPLRCKVELIQGPNSIKECIELYTEDGLERPFCTIISTPGSGNTVRISNTGAAEFPLTACVVPYSIENLS